MKSKTGQTTLVAATATTVLTVPCDDLGVLGLYVKNTGGNALTAAVLNTLYRFQSVDTVVSLLTSFAAGYTRQVHAPIYSAGVNLNALAAGAHTILTFDIRGLQRLNLVLTSAAGTTVNWSWSLSRNV